MTTSEIFNNGSFESELKAYQLTNDKAIQSLVDFLDNIETNKKYYRIGVQKNQRYRKTTTEDTENIKNINSLINRITETNYEKIKVDIIKKINKDYFIPLIVENLIEKSILHHRYIPLYVGVLKEIESQSKLRLINKNCDKHFNNFFKNKIVNEKDTFYEKLCSENKNIDNIIGFSILITHLEKEGILNGCVEKVLDPFMNTIDEANDIELFKMLTSFYNISQIYYQEIPEKYKQLMIEQKEKTKSSKIKFKIMDILGE